jgi:hypothetical protein
VRNARHVRNAAIIMVLAAIVAFAPAGGNAVEAIFTALVMGMLAGIAWTLYVLSRQQQLTLATLSDARRAVLFGALGLLALLIAGYDKLTSSGGGTLLLIVLFGASVAAIWRVWTEAQSY